MRNGSTLPPESLDAIVEILALVRTGAATSRSELIDRTQLSKAVVMQRVGELVSRGLLRETEAPSTGGRPPRRLGIDVDGGHLLVADVGATSIDVAVADAGGAILHHLGEEADVAAGPEAILGRVEALFERAVGEVGPTNDRWGIGIGLPGPVEFATGHPISPPIMPGWDGYPVRERLAERFGVPVWVDNDVNIMALGEWRSGVARGHEQVIFVKVGTGIGSGIISDGRIHRGAQGSAGDIGHIQVVDDAGEVCRCGKIGCLEAIAGGGAIARDADGIAAAGRSRRLASMREDHLPLTARDVISAASMGDRESVGLLERGGRTVGLTLAGLVNFFNPSLIVIGGGIASAGDPYLATIRGTIYARSAPLATRDLAVKLSELGDRAGIIGAASMVLDQLFGREHLGSWIDSGRPAGLEIAAA